ncbi:MAG: phenylalanine--tRNA ligase subunit alpha [Bacteroidetes bacterium]|nr:phenylalanine--tRNA ligase subunit alpha [Bacteroidota bacterium]
MDDRIKKIISEIDGFNAVTKEQVEIFRMKFLGKKSALADLFAEMKNIQPELRKDFGRMVNELKIKAEEKLNSFAGILEAGSDSGESETTDLSLPAEPHEPGARHPISIVRRRIIEIFSQVGFTVADGPEIEDDWHNFSALNFPENHPARDMQDTFFVGGKGGGISPASNSQDMALRTHTSSVQVRIMETSKPPIRILAPGRVYRNEAISARAHCFFHQVEGLYIDEGVSFADLKQTLLYFAKEMFSADTKIRLRPSYFPFTEPSAEMDISCNICRGKGCNVCKYTGWVEILGCGMVDPNVLENCKIDSKKYSGYAFGMGIERITMLKYQVKDLRLFSENDIRFLKQFVSS